MVIDQLRCAGVIEAIRISRAAYPNRMPHTECVLRFGILPGAVSVKNSIYVVTLYTHYLYNFIVNES
jgi:myosin heavy subunit